MRSSSPVVRSASKCAPRATSTIVVTGASEEAAEDATDGARSEDEGAHDPFLLAQNAAAASAQVTKV